MESTSMNYYSSAWECATVEFAAAALQYLQVVYIYDLISDLNITNEEVKVRVGQKSALDKKNVSLWILTWLEDTFRIDEEIYTKTDER